MVPGIRYYGLRAGFLAGFYCEAERPLLEDDAEQCRSKGYESGAGYAFAGDASVDFAGTVVADGHSDCEQHQSDDGGGEGFVFPVTVVVILVFGFSGNSDKNENYDVGEEVGK